MAEVVGALLFLIGHTAAAISLSERCGERGLLGYGILLGFDFVLAAGVVLAFV